MVKEGFDFLVTIRLRLGKRASFFPIFVPRVLSSTIFTKTLGTKLIRKALEEGVGSLGKYQCLSWVTEKILVYNLLRNISGALDISSLFCDI